MPLFDHFHAPLKPGIDFTGGSIMQYQFEKQPVDLQKVRNVLDEVKLGLIIPRDEYLLPRECGFEFKGGFKPPDSGEVVIAFDAEGRLDPSVSPQPFAFTIKSPADAQEITVGPGGTLQR